MGIGAMINSKDLEFYIINILSIWGKREFKTLITLVLMELMIIGNGTKVNSNRILKKEKEN